MSLALVDMRWISEEGVRWGRVGGAGFVGGIGDELGSVVELCGDEGGGVLGGVVEMARVVVVVGWRRVGRRWKGMLRCGVAGLKSVKRGLILGVGRCAGSEWMGDGIGWVLAWASSELSGVSIQDSIFTISPGCGE